MSNQKGTNIKKTNNETNHPGPPGNPGPSAAQPLKNTAPTPINSPKTDFSKGSVHPTAQGTATATKSANELPHSSSVELFPPVEGDTVKYKIFISRYDIPQSALECLKEYEIDFWDEEIPIPRDEFLERIDGVNALLVNSLDRVDVQALNTAGKNLKVIATLSSGLDHIDVQEAKKRGIKVGYTSDILSDAVAELTIGLLLQITRRIFEGNLQLRKGKWRKMSPWTWLNGFGLKDSVVGIFGLGKIGMEIGRRIAPFKPSKILYSCRQAKPDAAEINAEKVDLENLLKESDIVILSCSLNPSTIKIINREKLALMKPKAYLINVSRGDVIDQDALVEALKKKRIGGAALDVTTPEPLPKKHPLLKLDNCIVLPHMGSAETRTRIAMAEATTLNIVAGLKGNKLPYEV